MEENAGPAAEGNAQVQETPQLVRTKSWASDAPIDDIRSRIQAALARDLPACDLQLSLFVAAANHYRHHSVLKPCPTQYLQGQPDHEKDIESLRHHIAHLPRLTVVLKKLQRNEPIPHSVLYLLHWVLHENPLDLRLESVPKSECPAILALPTLHETPQSPKRASKVPQVLPTHIFKVRNSKTIRWSVSQDMKTMFAFHGSRTENFHSILSHGLQQHLTKNALFGHGIYLSTELDMCLNYSKVGPNWDQSCLGDQINCVLMCEVQDHPDVKLHTKDPSRGQLRDSQAGKIPEKYLIVRNNDLIQNRYLLVYATGSKGSTPASGRPSTGYAWLREHRYILMLVCYGILLLSMAMVNSTALRRWLRIKGFIA